MQILSTHGVHAPLFSSPYREPLASRLNAKKGSSTEALSTGFLLSVSASVQFDIEGVDLFDADIPYAQDRAVRRYPGPELERA
jgi:hypothetical protein